MFKNLFFIFAFLFSLTASAYQPGAVAVESVGGINTANGCLSIPEGNTNYYSIRASIPPAGASQVFHYYKNGVAYQVPAAKTFKARCHCYEVAGQDYNNFFIFSATNAFTDAAAIGTLTGPLYEGGSVTGWFHTSTTTFYSRCESYLQDFSASTYPGVYGRNPNINSVLIGYQTP